MDGTGISDVSVFAVTGRKTVDVEKSSFAYTDVLYYLGGTYAEGRMSLQNFCTGHRLNTDAAKEDCKRVPD